MTAAQRIGNWTPGDDSVEKKRRRRDREELPPAERLRQTIRISEFQLKFQPRESRHDVA